jgi:hypothetical protein
MMAKVLNEKILDLLKQPPLPPKRPARLFKTPEQIQDFLVNALGLDESLITHHRLDTILSELEILHEEHTRHGTFNDPTYRAQPFVTHESRVCLRNQIADEILSLGREDNEDQICLGHGGGLPKTSLRKEKRAIFVVGGPASGKSGIAARIADHFGAIVIDPDIAKWKLPEFSGGRGAALVHEESTRIVLKSNGDFLTVFERCTDSGHNMVLSVVGDKINKVLDLRDGLIQDRGYACDLVLVSLNRRAATIRALLRYGEQGRYVPLSYIHDEVGHEPILTYYRTRGTRISGKNKWSEHAAYSSDVPPGQFPRLVCSSKGWIKSLN